MSDDENVLDFGNDLDDEYGQMAGEQSGLEEGSGLLATYPRLGKAYNWILGSLDTLWEFAGVFQPVFKNSWVFFIIYLGISSNKQLSWTDLLPFVGRSIMEDDEEEF